MRSILVVDDSRAMRMLMGHYLRQLGYGTSAILEAPDGARALEMVRMHGPTLVLSDLYMPGMDGLELWRRIKADPALDPRFGLVTCAADKPTRMLAADAGVHFMLTKPFSEDRLEDCLRQAFSRRAANLRTGPVHVAVPEDASVFSIRLLVQKLIRTRNKVEPAPHLLELDSLQRPVVARYVLDDASTCGYAYMEMGTAVRMAGALTMLPHSVIREELMNPSPDGILESNLHELFSILSQLFNRGGRVRARLDRSWRDRDPLPPELFGVIDDPCWRADARVSIAGYGGGAVTIIGHGSKKVHRRDPISHGGGRPRRANARPARQAPSTGELLNRRRR